MNGNNIIVTWNNVPIAATKSTTIKVGADTLEIASPDAAKWRQFIAGRKDWSLTVGYLVTASNKVRDLLQVRGTFSIIVKGRDATTAQGVKGTAILTECQITATRGNLVQGSFSFQGSGALE